jgi:hypothetical protein
MGPLPSSGVNQLAAPEWPASCSRFAPSHANASAKFDAANQLTNHHGPTHLITR